MPCTIQSLDVWQIQAKVQPAMSSADNGAWLLPTRGYMSSPIYSAAAMLSNGPTQGQGVCPPTSSLPNAQIVQVFNVQCTQHLS